MILDLYNRFTKTTIPLIPQNVRKKKNCLLIMF